MKVEIYLRSAVGVYEGSCLDILDMKHITRSAFHPDI